MKNVLIVVAHPKTQSLTMSMVKSYKEASQKAGNSIEVLDLYRCEKQQLANIASTQL